MREYKRPTDNPIPDDDTRVYLKLDIGDKWSCDFPVCPENTAAIYDTLPFPLGATTSIRLIEIQSGFVNDKNEPISCKLRLGSPKEPYIALSYMWGEDTANHKIILNGKPFNIRQNLWDFLQQARDDQTKEGISHRFWIDALCINQTSIAERNHQVGMMGQIYSKASSVLAWLGSETESLKRAFAFLQYVIQLDTDMQPDEIPWKDIVRVVEHPYWSRAWIIQECILATVLHLQSGFLRVPVTALEWLYQEVHMLGDKLERCLALEIVRMRKAWHCTADRPYIIPWKFPWLNTCCSDTRDKVYALSALMDPTLGVVPDYNKTTEELLLDITDRIRASKAGSMRLVYWLGINYGDLTKEQQLRIVSRQTGKDRRQFSPRFRDH